MLDCLRKQDLIIRNPKSVSCFQDKTGNEGGKARNKLAILTIIKYAIVMRLRKKGIMKTCLTVYGLADLS